MVNARLPADIPVPDDDCDLAEPSTEGVSLVTSLLATVITDTDSLSLVPKLNERPPSRNMLGNEPLPGLLDTMCSRKEALDREQTRQLDRFECLKGTDPKKPSADLTLVTKRYQRSAADKSFQPSDVRTLDACRRTAKFLVTEVLDLDQCPNPDRFDVRDVTFNQGSSCRPSSPGLSCDVLTLVH